MERRFALYITAELPASTPVEMERETESLMDELAVLLGSRRWLKAPDIEFVGYTPDVGPEDHGDRLRAQPNDRATR